MDLSLIYIIANFQRLDRKRLDLDDLLLFVHIILCIVISVFVVPMIVFFSAKYNAENISRERQRINNEEWNKTKNQQWEMKCAIQERKERKAAIKSDSNTLLNTEL